MLLAIGLYLGLMAFIVLGMLFCYRFPGFVYYVNLPQNRMIALILGLFSLSVLVSS